MATILEQKLIPGLVFSELLGNDSRSVKVEINLDQEILHKLFLRYNGHTPTHSRFRYGKVDMTREQDLNGIGKHWKVPAGITVDPLQYVNSYIWYNKKSNIPYEN